METLGRLRRARHGTERGAVAVEFALILPIMLMILFGLVTAGLAYQDHLSATNAVREGARYGAAADVNSSWATSVRDRVKEVYFNAGVTVTNSQICAKLVDSAGNPIQTWTGSNCGTAPSLPASMQPGSCAALVWMSRPEKIQLIVFPDMNFDIGAESVARYSRKLTTTCTAE